MRNVPTYPVNGDQIAGPSPLRLTTYGTYAEAQAAVDSLSDHGLPLSSLSIVWRDLCRFEQITGRRTIGNAAIEGLAAGAWFGALAGMLSVVLVDSVELSITGLVSGYLTVGLTAGVCLLLGAIAGAGWQATSQWLRSGAGDFASFPRLDAEAYELWVNPAVASPAAELLGLVSPGMNGRASPRPVTPVGSVR
jgi:hypothetical protein